MIESISAPAGSPVQKTSSDTSANGNASEAPAKAAVTVDTSPISPRLRFDTASGVVVTEFLHNGKDVQAQVPSVAVLAYLRAGLQADGLSKRSETESSAPTKD